MGRFKFAALVLSVLLAGCGGKQRQAEQLPNTQLQRAPVAAQSRTVPTPASSTRPIYQPRSKQDIEAAYRLPAFVSTPRPAIQTPLREPVAVQPADEDYKVVAEPGWDLPIAREWNHIVIHHSASANGSAAAFDKAHRERGWDGLGYHFVIGNGTGSSDGEVEVGYRWRKQGRGAHAGNDQYNEHGIGICLVGDFQRNGRPSAKQMASLRRLVRFLQVKTGVPTAEVVGHCNVPGKNTECPGQSLDLAAFRASLGGGAIGVPIVTVPRGGTARLPMLTRPARSGAAVP